MVDKIIKNKEMNFIETFKDINFYLKKLVLFSQFIKDKNNL